MSAWTITNLRSELRVHLGNLDTTDLPNTDADLLLNRAKWHTEESLKLPQNEIHDTFNTVASQAVYPQTFPFDAIIRLAREDDDQEELVPLSRISEDDYNASLKLNAESEAKPESYFRRGTDLILWPTPDDVYTIRYTRRELLDDLSDSVTTLSMSKALQDIVLYQAVVFGFIRQRDYNAATRLKNFLDGLIRSYSTTDVKDEGGDHFMQVQVIRNEYNPS